MRNRTVSRTVSRTASSALLTALGGIALLGCGGQPATSADPATSANEALAAIVACGLDDGTIEPDAHLHACDPSDVKKTTICHIPPGNPANAHTLCVGNAAVPHHVKNHGDLVGPCEIETPCPPPPPPSCDDTHGKGKHDGAGNECDAGTGGTTGAGGSSGAGGAPAPMCPDGQVSCSSDPTACSPDVTYCNNGCCVPIMPV